MSVRGANALRAPSVPAPAEPDRLVTAVNIADLVRLGWDPKTQVLAPDPAHPLLGYGVCPCGNEADRSEGRCATCRSRRHADPDGSYDDVPASESSLQRRHEDLCAVCRVPGAHRPAAVHGLCLSCNRLRASRGQSVEGFVGGDPRFGPAKPRPGFGACAVGSCERLAAHGDGLCRPHDQAWRRAGRPDLETFCRTGVPARGDRGGRIVLRGLPEEVIVELLYGVHASVAEGRQVTPRDLRAVVDHLRRLGVHSVATVLPEAKAASVRRFLAFTVDRVALASSDLASEYAKDVWDLRVWGRRGRLSFVGGKGLRHGVRDSVRPISQRWLIETAKSWAFEALASTDSGQVCRVIAAVGLWSEHLGRRDDGGADPAALGHQDVEAFLARLHHLEQAGELSGLKRARTATAVAQFLRECRELGFTQAGQVLASLPDDVVFRRRDRSSSPARRDPDEAGRALPEMVLAQLLSTESLETLERLAGPGVRAAVELLAAVGRRTAELCGLAFDCLDHDTHADVDGELRRTPVLVHDMPKANKIACRLPIHDREAAIISAQQARVRAAFPHTPTARLALFPRSQTNPDGTKPFAPCFLQRALRAWVDGLPRLDSPERDGDGRPVPFPRERVFPYAFRHGFAQRHADAGTPVDTLKELMGHDAVRTTLGYYRVTAKRKREAQDRLGPLQLAAGARLVRPGLAGLPQSEAMREQVGQVAVPFGICTEPSNVAADGRSCPFRHRCLGCEHFRTDPSYQPELQSYLAKLLEDRERLSAAIPELAEWARRDAAPSEEEVEALRRLISENDKAMAELDHDDREALDAAITTIRNSRANLAVSFPIELRGLVRQTRPALFPAIERAARSEAHGD